MRKQFHRMYFKVVCLAVLGAVLLQSSAATIYAAPKAQQTAAAAQPAPPSSADSSNVVDGHTIDDRDTLDTNFFLANDPGGAKYLETLSSRGIDPFKMRYVAVGSVPGNTSDSDGLVLMTEKLNQAAAKCGGAKVLSTEAWIGAAETSSGAPEGGLLFVANLVDGSRQLVAALNANDQALNGKADPVISAGNFFGSTAMAACFPIIVIIICWIRCIVFQQILILLRCFIVNIIICVRLGWIIICFRARIIQCKIIIIIRTIVICFIQCIVIYIGDSQVKPGGGDGRILARNLPKARGTLSSAVAKVRSTGNRRLAHQARG